LRIIQLPAFEPNRILSQLQLRTKDDGASFGAGRQIARVQTYFMRAMRVFSPSKTAAQAQFGSDAVIPATAVTSTGVTQKTQTRSEMHLTKDNGDLRVVGSILRSL
jgi:hypothetical protein